MASAEAWITRCRRILTCSCTASSRTSRTTARSSSTTLVIAPMVMAASRSTTACAAPTTRSPISFSAETTFSPTPTSTMSPPSRARVLAERPATPARTSHPLNTDPNLPPGGLGSTCIYVPGPSIYRPQFPCAANDPIYDPTQYALQRHQPHQRAVDAAQSAGKRLDRAQLPSGLARIRVRVWRPDPQCA